MAEKKAAEPMEATEPAAAPEKTKRTRKPKADGGTKASEMTRDDLIRFYLDVYGRCMREDPKSFDAKGALSALDQISRILGLDTPIRSADVDGNRVVLTLAERVGDRGD